MADEKPVDHKPKTHVTEEQGFKPHPGHPTGQPDPGGKKLPDPKQPEPHHQGAPDKTVGDAKPTGTTHVSDVKG
jgi:hypothetical protein